ncbi:MAG: AAA family ATPase [Alphaproteobacteria bacterium]|nr:AAA family ATPase [Alphaproteobacteria bacterium]
MSAKALKAKNVAPPSFAFGARRTGDVFSLSSHKRARDALAFGLCMGDPGFNIFVLGPDRSGRMSATLGYLRSHVTCLPRPHDWVYLNNFRRSHRPKPYRLPGGVGRSFRDRMAALVPQLRDALVGAFGGEGYQSEVRARSEAAQNAIGGEMDSLRSQAQQHGLDVLQTAQGMMIVSAGADGNSVPVESLPAAQREALQPKATAIAEALQDVTRRAARVQADLANRLVDLNRQVADNAIGTLLDDLQREYSGHRGLARWLVELRNDIIDNFHAFLPRAADAPAPTLEPPERRYAVNLLVDHSDDEIPGVVLEANPTYENLFGQIEYRAAQGGMETDFSLIRAGALHRANGGILVLRAEALARHAESWAFLKGALRDGKIQLEERHRANAVPIASAPRPKPVPLEVKVIIVGSPHWYYTFFSVDPEFQTYFKVKADIDGELDAVRANLNVYAGLIRDRAQSRHGATCDDTSIAKLLGVASRWAGHRRKITAQFEQVDDVLSEAAQIAQANGAPAITAKEIDAALRQRRDRNARIEDRMHESIADGTVMIDTTGVDVGQINGLTVRDLGDHRFGAPSRITARATPGRQGVVNIERAVEMSGPIQQKGVMVLQGFIAGHFARRFPLSFNSSITFEQSYGGVEGDSASMAELLAILSDLSGVPLRQDIAITGSVNQRGEAQAVGGVPHKIEGFYRTCVDSGKLTGSQGVVIPAANEANVILLDPLLADIEAGRFHVWSVKRIEDAIELFTGMKPGRQRADGSYSPDSVYGRVMQQLETFDEILRERAVRP